MILTYLPKLINIEKKHSRWTLVYFFITFKRACKINFRLSTVIISSGFLFVCSFVLELYFGVCLFVCLLHVFAFSSISRIIVYYGNN